LAQKIYHVFLRRDIVKKEISLVGYGSSDIMIPFEIEVPHDAKRSYSGRFSEYYWILETSVDVSVDQICVLTE
jgi:hypothetical protein